MVTQVFEKDFSVRALFTALKQYDFDYVEDDTELEAESAVISAYLAQPVVEVSLQTNKGYNKASYKIDQPLVHDPQLGVLGDDRNQQFRRAGKALRLEISCTHTYLEKQVTEQYSGADWRGVKRSRRGCFKKEIRIKDPRLMILGSGELESFDFSVW